jgi:hypothetical protein
MTYYEENPSKNPEKVFTYEGITKTVLASDILAKCGKDAYKLITCIKGRYGYNVLYSGKKGTCDSRDSNQTSGFVYFMDL